MFTVKQEEMYHHNSLLSKLVPRKASLREIVVINIGKFYYLCLGLYGYTPIY